MKKYHLAFLLPVLLLGNSCNNCIKVPLKKADLMWYKGLPAKGDTVFFKGSDNTVDTFVVSVNGLLYTDCNRFERGKYQYEEFRVTGRMINKKVRDSFINSFDIYFSKELQTDSAVDCYKHLQVFDLYSEDNKSLDIFKTETLSIKSLNKQVVTYYISDSANTEKRSSSWVKVKSFNWSKDYGLLRYTTQDGVVFDYWKKK